VLVSAEAPVASVGELYDGESRSRFWWKVVRRHSALLSALLSLLAPVWLVWLDMRTGSGGGYGVEGLWILGLMVVVGFLIIWPVLLGVSLLAPRLAFSLFYWNAWLIAVLFTPATIIAALLSRWPLLAFTAFVGVFASGIAIKTVILYRRFSIVAIDRGRQQLPL
jgi:hypothetical protein